MGLYLLLDGTTGEPLRADRRTAADAVAHRLRLGARRQLSAREDASRLLIIGAGALAPFLARAHAAVRPISEIRIWNRTPSQCREGRGRPRHCRCLGLGRDRSR